MSKPPKIVIPGLNRGAGIPPGYLVGRRPGVGRGQVELLSLRTLQGMGISSKKQNTSLGHQAGFGFSVEGLPTANEFIGTAVWSRLLTFHNGDAANVVVAAVAATSTAVWRILDNLLNLAGTITFSAGGTVEHGYIVALIRTTPGVLGLTDTAMTINGAATNHVLAADTIATWAQTASSDFTWVNA